MKLLTLLQLVAGGNGSRRSAGFLALFTQLREAELNLKQDSGRLETQFLATSSELERLAQFGDRFVRHVEKLVGLATGKECDGSVFSNAIRLIEQATQFLVGCQEQTVQMLELLRNYNTQIEQLLGVEAELQRTMSPLKFMQTLFKSEAAPLGSAVQQMFSALTQEMEGLHGQVRDIFGTKFKQLEQTHRTIGQVIGQLDEQARSLRKLTSTHKVQIESTLEILRKEMISNQERDTRLSQLSKKLAHEVEQIVMGLQFQDIISQKLQHVTAALPQIESKFAEFQAAPNTSAATESLQFLHQSCRLEAGQIEAAEHELARAELAIQGGVEKVLSHLTEMDSECLSLAEFKLLTTSFDGMVHVLIETIEEVRKLVAETVASATEAYEMLRPLGSFASDLTAVVRDMSSRIHLIGLNAQVQAAQAALDRRGAGLEVLSARTSEISEETNRISKQAAGQLDQLAAGLAESVKAFGQLRINGLTQQTILNQQGAAEELQLHAIRDSALETLREIGDSLDEIQKQAARTLATVQFSEFHQVTLPALREPLVAIAAAVDQWLQAHGSGVAHGSLIDGFKRDYTMASEREVFAGVMSANHGSSPPLPAADPARNPEMEMFAGLPAAPAGVATPAEPKPEPAAGPGPANPGDRDLGDNVELF